MDICWKTLALLHQPLQNHTYINNNILLIRYIYMQTKTKSKIDRRLHNIITFKKMSTKISLGDFERL